MSFNTPQEVASELSTRITQLCDMSECDLKTEMQQLKSLIKENPAACSLLLDEDIGKMVAALRKITGNAIAQATASKSRAKKAAAPKHKALTAEELAAALDDEDF